MKTVNFIETTTLEIADILVLRFFIIFSIETPHYILLSINKVLLDIPVGYYNTETNSCFQ